MKFRVIDTTDDKYEGDVIEFTGRVMPGDVLEHKGGSIKVDSVSWVSDRVVKLSSSNYIIMLKIIG